MLIDDSVDGVRYVCWARPGTAVSAAAWRIAKLNFPGNICNPEAGGVLWADGDGNYDNRADQRLTLTYSANDGIGFAALDTIEDPAGARPGTVFTLAAAMEVVAVKHNTVWLDRVATGPGVNEYAVSGAIITTGLPVEVGDSVRVLVSL